MKLTMVNDCAYVGETVLKYLPQSVEKTHIKRSRDFWSKTFGIAYKIWKAKADVYHVHYLLQDCYLANVFNKRPLIGHAHGSDLLNTLTCFALGRLVTSNLRKCDKILVSTPDLLGIAQSYRQDAEYLPNPVDMELFNPKPLKVHGGRVKILVASGADWTLKGTDIIIQGLAALKENVEVSLIGYGKDLEKTMVLAKSLALDIKMLPQVPHQIMNDYYWDSDVVIGQGRFKTGVLGLVSLEAIASGRPVIANVSSKFPEYESFPMRDIDSSAKITEAIKNADDLTDLWQKQYAYFKENHDAKTVTARMLRMYEALQRA